MPSYDLLPLPTAPADDGEDEGFQRVRRRDGARGHRQGGAEETDISMTADSDASTTPQRKISVLGREFAMPRSRGHRITIGMVLVVLGMFGFLPILGFWMIPLGLLVLSYEIASVRRWRRRFVVWRERRRRPR